MAIREDLNPYTDKSAKILNLLRNNFDLSYRHMSANYNKWDDVEGDFRTYRMEDEEDRESEKRYGVRKIIVPIQFATHQIMLTFLMEIFTALGTMLRVRGADPVSVHPARIMELCLNFDYKQNRGYFTINQWLSNALRYGLGVIENSWHEKFIIRKVLRPTEQSVFNFGGQEFQTQGAIRYQNTAVPVFEGNKWRIVDPRLFFPDPRVSISNFQDGIFCGHRTTIHDMEIEENANDGLFFNEEYVRRGTISNMGRGGEGGAADHNRDRWRGSPYLETALSAAKKDGTHILEQQIVKIIPKDYGLDDEERPQDWLFRTIDGQVIVSAEVNPFNRFPYSVTESYPDCLAFMAQGIMELTEPLAKHISFLFNSHMANVRRIVKDLVIVDPSRIDIRDLQDNQDGGFVRLLAAGYGQDPSSFAKQLPITDVTSGHLTSIENILQMWERITGASSHMFGQISSGRRTAYELQGVFRQAGARMKMMADLMSSEGIAPLTEQMALMRQENMRMEQFIEIAGKSAESLGVKPSDIMNGFLRITPGQVQNAVFNFPAEEGVLPQDRAAAGELLQEVFNTVASNPFLTQAFDLVAIFREMIREKGLKNMDDFLNSGLKTQTMIMTPDELANLYAQGKITQMGGGNNGGGRSDQGVVRDRETLGLEGALNGAGASYNS